MTSTDEFFQEDSLEEQLDALAQKASQSSATPNSRAYHSLRQFHAEQAEAEVQSLERVRRRLASHVMNSIQQKSQGETSIAKAPLPVRAKRPRRLSRLRAISSTLAAVLVVSFLLGGFLVLLHSRLQSTGVPGPRIVAGTWQIIPSPNTSLSVNALGGIAANSSSDAWAVGLASSSEPVTQENPLVEHWDGQHWHIVSTPALSEGGILSSVITLAPDNAWAVGEEFSSPTIPKNNANTQALIEHWNGTSWTIIPSPNVNSNNNNLNAVAAISANDVWAVGWYYTDNNISNTLIEQWNGTSWVIVPSPSPGPYGSALTSVTAVSLNNVWAVGAYTNFTNDVNVSQTLTERWNGTSWNVAFSPNKGHGNNSYRAIAHSFNHYALWAVGSYYNNQTASEHTLIANIC